VDVICFYLDTMNEVWQREGISRVPSHCKQQLVNFGHVCFFYVLISKEKIILITVTLELSTTFDTLLTWLTWCG